MPRVTRHAYTLGRPVFGTLPAEGRPVAGMMLDGRREGCLGLCLPAHFLVTTVRYVLYHRISPRPLPLDPMRTTLASRLRTHPMVEAVCATCMELLPLRRSTLARFHHRQNRHPRQLTTVQQCVPPTTTTTIVEKRTTCEMLRRSRCHNPDAALLCPVHKPGPNLPNKLGTGPMSHALTRHHGNTFHRGELKRSDKHLVTGTLQLRLPNTEHGDHHHAKPMSDIEVCRRGTAMRNLRGMAMLSLPQAKRPHHRKLYSTDVISRNALLLRGGL